MNSQYPYIDLKGPVDSFIVILFGGLCKLIVEKVNGIPLKTISKVATILPSACIMEEDPSHHGRKFGYSSTFSTKRYIDSTGR